MEVELTIDIVSSTLVRGALNNGIELFGVDNLIHFEAACLTSVNSDLHAWLNIAGTSDDTANCNQLTDVLSLDLSHLHDVLLAVFAGNHDSLEVTLELRGNSSHWICISASAYLSDNSLLLLDLTGHLQVISSLVHNHIEGCQVLVSEVDAGLRHMTFYELVEKLHVCRCIFADSLDEAKITVCSDIDKENIELANSVSMIFGAKKIKIEVENSRLI